MTRKVLVLEDEANIRSFVVINLKRAGYDAIEAGTGEEALAQIQRNPDVQVALLDIMLPGEMDGFEVCRRIRAGNSQMGIIMLTARTQEMDKVSGLMMGADDYVEYSIVKLFMENPGKALSREEILEAVWGTEFLGELKIVDVNIRRLRIKLEDDPQNPSFVITVWGFGYKWEA